VSKVWEGTQEWSLWAEVGIACPMEWELGTRLVIAGRKWTCMDHGGAIVYQDGIPWIDMLTPELLFPHGTIVEATIYPP